MKKVKQRPQFIWGSLIGSIGNIASSVINNNARNKLVKEQMAEQARQNAINNNQLAVNNLNNYYASQNNLDNAYKATFEDQIVYRNGGKARPKASWGMLATLGGLAGTAIDGFASQGFGYNKLEGGNYANNVNTNPNIKYSVNPASTGANLVYRKGGTATQHPRRRELTDAQYYSIMKQVAIDNWRKWGDASPAAAFNRAINSNAYDYRGYYNKYPNSRANADTHWTDEFKGVGEKTFSDQSKYSGVKHPKYNPNGIRGGHWYGANEDMFVPSIQQLVERSKFRRGGMTYKPVKQPDVLDRIGNWVNKNKKSNVIAKIGYNMGFDKSTIKHFKSDVKDLINHGILPNFTSDNGLLSAAGPLSGPVRSASAIAKGVQNASKIRQAANASKATQAVRQSAKAEGSNVMKYIQQRANPNSIYNGRVNTIKMRSPFGQLRNRLANRNQLNALEEKTMAERYRRDPSKFIQDLVGGNIETEAAIRRSQAAARSARQASKAAAKARKPTFSQTNTVNGGRVPVRRPAEQPTRFNGNTSTGTVNGGRIQPRQPATQPASTAKPAFSDAPVAPNAPARPVGSATPVAPASSATQAKPINTSNILNLAHTDAITRWGITHPKSAIASILGIPTAIGVGAGFINIAANKPVNKPKAKGQPQQAKKDTVQVANQTPNDSIIIKDKVQPGEVVHRDSIYKANDGESYVKVGDKTGNTWVNIKNVPANTPAVSNNKITDSRNLGKSQTQQTKAAAQTIQRKGRIKSRAVANRNNNIRQNLNFEPINDTVNGYSQVEDVQGRSYDEYKADVEAEAEARRQEVVNDLLSNYNYEDRNTTDEMRYGGKARSKKRVPIKITDGGVAQRIGNNTFLLRGGSHEQVNPSGQTGIGIKVGNNEIEAEGGEVAQRVGNALRIFSAQPMINGVSPAQAVEAGANKNRIFAIQEALKRNSNNNVFRNGGIKKVGPTYNPETKSWYNANGAKLKKGHGYYSQAANKFVQYNSDGTVSKFTINQWAKLKGKTQSYNVGNKAIPLLGMSNNGRNISFYAPKRVRNNVSPTKKNSEQHENWANQNVNYIGNNTNKFSKEGINLAFATPYGSKEVIINGRPVSANMLDSIAYNAGLNKYNKSQLPYAFGIPAHETINGRTIGSTTDKKQQRINYNANTFRNYGVFNSASLLNDYHNENKGVSDYYHALDLFRRGLYNTNKPEHRSLVYDAGIAEWNDKNFQKYWNEQGNKQYQRGLKDTAKKQYYDKLILSNDDVRNYYKRLAYKRYFRCGGRVKFAPGGKVNPIFKYSDYAGIEDLPNSNTGILSGTYNNGNLNLGQSENLIFPKGFVSHDSNNIGSRQTNNNNAPVDNWWNRNGMSVNSSDWIGLGTDLVGSLTLGALNANNYKNLKYDYKLPNYVDETPVAFDTTYHNDAQRATVERNRLNAQKIIANNTSSANTALQRMQQSNADAMMETNKLWDEKANKEAELRNTAAQNEQQVRARNAAARNQYYQNVAEIENKRIDAENANKLAHSNAWATSLQGIQGAANNFLNSTRQRFEDENALMATIAAGDAATPYRMMAFGTQFGPRVINAVRAMNNIEGMKDPGAAPIRSNYSNDADYSTARSKWESAMKNYEYWKQRNQFLSHYDKRGRLIKRR